MIGESTMTFKRINPKKFKNYSRQELANYIEKLEEDLAVVNQKNEELELLLETITDFATQLENEIHNRNKEMSLYIDQVKELTKAAVAVQNNTFEPGCLDIVVSRDDPLGVLAKVFETMVNNLKDREKELANAKEQLESVLNAVPGTICWINTDGFYIGVNQHLAQTFNRSPDEFVGKKIDFWESSPEFCQFIDCFLKSDQISLSKEVLIQIKGQQRCYLMLARKYNEEKTLLSVGIDITEKQKIQEKLELERNAFARFVPSEYLHFLGHDNILNIKLGDHVSREVSILFSDIRSFTSLSETMNPQEIFNFINSYLSSVSPVIRTYNGFIMKYIGDSIMAAFPNGANDAVNAAIAHIDRVNEYNRGRKRAGYIPIKIGIGIHIGYMMLGIVGESQRLQGDALSDSVNLASRLEGLTKIYGASILISDSVVAKLENPNHYKLRFLDSATVKGRKGVIDLYEVLDGESEKSIKLKLQTKKFFEEGLHFYKKAKWLKAQYYFNKVLTINEFDQAAVLYLNRIETLKNQVDPKTWNGIWHFTQK